MQLLAALLAQINRIDIASFRPALRSLGGDIARPSSETWLPLLCRRVHCSHQSTRLLIGKMSAELGSKRPRDVSGAADVVAAITPISADAASKSLPLLDGEDVRLTQSHVKLHIGTFDCGSGTLFVTTE